MPNDAPLLQLQELQAQGIVGVAFNFTLHGLAPRLNGCGARLRVDHRALLNAFGSGHCVWSADWPFLRAPQRLDCGPLLRLFGFGQP